MVRRKIAEGNTADIFEIEEGKVLKLFKKGYSKNDVRYEYNNHSMVRKKIKNTPKLFSFVEENQRYGFIMEKMQGESLAARMLHDAAFDHAMEIFTGVHKEWLTQTMDDANSYTEWMLSLVRQKSPENDLEDKIKNLPSGNVLCHGDFHPYSIIIRAENDYSVIDFANVCKGPKEYDIARTYFLLKEAVSEKPIAECYLEQMHLRYTDIRTYVDVLNDLRLLEKTGM